MLHYNISSLNCFFFFRFGYNIVICYEYINEGKTKKALEIIGEIETILSSVGSNDNFLKSIRIALNHITFSMKGYLLKLCSNETMVCITSLGRNLKLEL